MPLGQLSYLGRRNWDEQQRQAASNKLYNVRWAVKELSVTLNIANHGVTCETISPLSLSQSPRSSGALLSVKAA